MTGLEWQESFKFRFQLLYYWFRIRNFCNVWEKTFGINKKFEVIIKSIQTIAFKNLIVEQVSIQCKIYDKPWNGFQKISELCCTSCFEGASVFAKLNPAYEYP